MSNGVDESAGAALRAPAPARAESGAQISLTDNLSDGQHALAGKEIAGMNDGVSTLLGAGEAERRELLLAGLSALLAERGVRTVLARHHRLVLGRNSGYAQSGMAEPVLHILPGCGVRTVTTDGTSFRLDSCDEHATGDLAGAAERIASTPEPAAGSGPDRPVP